jgi:hypothetical protein
MIKNTFYLFIYLFIVSCSSKPGLNNSGKNKPDWITRQPADDSFWYGVGESRIKSDNPRQVARQRAFSEIAEQLKVNIKSKLTDIMQATNNDFEVFSKTVIETRVDASLEYVENIDSYQDKNRQYVLARLDKNKYFAKINNKKEEALLKANNLLKQSIGDMSGNSLSNISLAIEAINPFTDLFPMLSDPFNNGEEGNAIVVAEKMIRKYNEDVELTFSPKSIDAMTFINDNEKVFIHAKSNSSVSKVSNIRINIRLNDKKSDEFLITDKNGKAEYQLSRLSAPSGNHALIFTLDYGNMMSKKAQQIIPVIPKEYSLDISLKSPKIYLDGNVSNLGDKVKNSRVFSALKECLEDNYSSTFVESKRKSDIILILTVSTDERAARMGDNYPFIVYATGSISLVNKNTGEEVLNSSFKDAKGADFNSKEKAGLSALKKLSQNMNIDICN